ncbi:GTPase HflX [Hahella sp. CCB-MM4]|uniref:ribosome rescue GTPase HflX n=1 Tax=Hahella sp. (strain CCB-MM4) TaxID=1926491 RepID=UPI000B9A9D28|nr:ribosome rescue GTPase HflX [Hahella sp. CCB-MM4]OZG71523.1 GTPase HflX [Hahella sp. CCB-MM4]
MFERPKSGERAVLVHLDMLEEKDREDPREFTELALSAGADPVALVSGSRNHPSPRYFVGSGKLEEIKLSVVETQADVVLFNHALTPSQERNLERDLGVRVLDRIGLILDIFAQRARTHEGKLQVELAQLEHLSTRLVRGWTHLERQKGGIGLRGPGETQLETDRRLIRGRIKSILKRLEKVRKQREQGRRARQRADVPSLSLVGYTNAGKSTLFNSLTSAEVYAADQLFATLDPTLRRINFSSLGPVVLADTVGFIRHLPHKLVNAFHATLEETLNASLLLHVVDASDPDRRENIEQVEAVLDEIGADGVSCLFVFNKIDCLEGVEPKIERDEEGKPARVWVSAKTGAGLELIEEAVAELLGNDMLDQTLHLPPSLARVRAQLYEREAVMSEQIDSDGSFALHVRMPKSDWNQLERKANIRLHDLLGQQVP